MDLEQKNLINELSQGKELAEQLRNHLNPSSSLETRLFLVDKLLSSYEKALCLLNWVELSHSYPNSTPTTDVSLQPSKKKRKTQIRCTEEVKVCSGTGAQAGPPDDGYSWRKYGQKDILGANFPRGYFRCIHRHSQGCLAIKQVQRSDQDPSIFEVTYRGRHTCVQASHFTSVNENSIQNKDHHHQQQIAKEVKTQDLEIKKESFPSLSFLDELNESDESNNFAASLSPTSDQSNYFSDSYGISLNVRTPDSNLIDIISTSNSVANSPIGDLDFSNFDFEIEPNFQFDNLEFFA
ncbi:hypothetical protein JCGZ_14281 [Jatropha curcas]|uniref:WRKY transcription factor n=1 Tax=Jatropha curcas TaxID=180498 RepID=S5CFV8_JATCU|nr:probable WRKY transcription factor 46 [Jatropha curcas]AGQ04246.1 WRKY transcription factor 52 [Jatropha curcas]ALU34123.1 WRKY transcription factor [Jatropha curcas]KDP28510.1 hypothetical protein JCGZ_14281 [Jatropha curcas]